MSDQIGPLDFSIIIVYLLGIVGLGCWVGIRHRRKGAESKGFFLAGGTLTWPVIGLALFSTNISTIHLVSLAQEGYVNGLAYGNFEWMAPFTLIITALFFAPFYIRSKVATLPDFLEMRYSRPCRDWLAVLSIVAAIFIHIGFSLYTGAVVLEAMLGIPTMVSIIAIAVLVGIYTTVGGLISVVITESIETVVLLLGAVIITAIALYEVGGFDGIHQTLEAKGELVKLTVLRSADDPSNLPWYSVFLGYPVIGIWYWCADQTIVQRVLGAKNENHARVGPLFAGFIKILPVFLFVLPGLMCYVLIQKGALDEKDFPRVTVGAEVLIDDVPAVVPETGRIDLAGTTLFANLKTYDFTEKKGHIENRVIHMENADGQVAPIQDTEKTYAFMIQQLLPKGLKGVIAAALLAALMGTVSGSLNSIATLFSYDIVKRWRPKTSDRRLVFIGRCATVVAMIVAILWSPLIARFPSIFQGIVSLICYIAPPITAVFVLGVLWKRSSSIAAQLTLYVGSAMGLTVFLLDWFRDHTGWNLPSMMAGFYLCVICIVFQIAVSLIRPHRHTPESEKLVWNHPLEAIRSPGWRGIGNYKFLATLLFVTMVVLYWIFR